MMAARLLTTASTVVSALKESVLVGLGVVSALLAVEPALVGLFGLLTLADLATVGFDKARRVGYRVVPGRLVAGPLARFFQALVVLVVSVAFANAFVLLRFLADFAVAYVAWRAGAAAIDHVLPPDNDFRRVWDGVWARIERTLGPDGAQRPDGGPADRQPEDRP